MCGIFGGRSTKLLGLADSQLVSAFQHRGPNSNGVWRDPSGLVLGHNRLAILDVSLAGHQPMASPSGRFVITYNGEIYNFQEVKERLSRRDYRGGSDTEVILAAIDELGLEATLDLIDGIFAFGLWDIQTKTLSLARDRFGIKPLVFGWAHSDFFFASDTRFVRQILDKAPEIESAALESYLQYGFITAPRTIYQNIYKLHPGHFMVLDEGALRHRTTYSELASKGLIRPYWSAKCESNRSIGHIEAKEELTRLLTHSVKSQMISDVPLGAFLSGGIDSSTIVGLMAKSSPSRIKTFSIGFSEAAYNEAPYARKVAEHLGTEHFEQIFSPEQASQMIPDLCEVFDEPFGDSSQLPTLLVSQVARKEVTVVLSGDAGDELFGGYPRYRWAERFLKIQQSVPRPFRNIASSAIRTIGADRWQAILLGFNPLLPKSLPRESLGLSAMTVARLLKMDSLPQVYNFLMSQWPRILAGDQLKDAEMENINRRILYEGTGSSLERMTRWDTAFYLPDDILTKVDRTSMWYGLEARVPLLDRRIVEFVNSLSPEIRFAGRAKPKLLLREVLTTMIPAPLIDREKQGFGVPVELWLRSHLRDWAEGVLPAAAKMISEVCPAIDVKREWNAYVNGKGRWNPGIWSALMLGSWAGRWLR